MIYLAKIFQLNNRKGKSFKKIELKVEQKLRNVVSLSKEAQLKLCHKYLRWNILKKIKGATRCSLSRKKMGHKFRLKYNYCNILKIITATRGVLSLGRKWTQVRMEIQQLANYQDS